MTIDINKQYTSNGEAVRILCTDRHHDKPVVTVSEDGSISTFTSDGKWLSSEDSCYDLKEVWAPSEGELCYFWDDSTRGVTVRAYKYYASSNANYVYVDATDTAWKHCAKFDGTLPERFVK